METFYTLLTLVISGFFLLLTVLKDRKDYFNHINKNCK